MEANGRLTAILIALLTQLSWAASNDNPYRVGARWSYVAGDQSTHTLLLEGITKISTPTGDVHGALIRRSDGGDRLILRSEEGWFECGASRAPDGTFACLAPLRFFQERMKPGERWTSGDFLFVALRSESVELPAGTFSNAWRISYTPLGGVDPLGEMWISERVGRVRITERGIDYRLTEFRSGTGETLPLTNVAALQAFFAGATRLKRSGTPYKPSWLERINHRLLYSTLLPALALLLLAGVGWKIGTALRDRSQEETLPTGTTASELSKLLAAVAQGGDLRQARKGLEKLVEQHPNYADLQHQLALLYRSEGNFEKAKLHLRQALRLNPDYSEARLNLAHLLLATGEGTLAAGEFRAVVERHPTYADAQLGLGRALLQAGNSAAAALALRDALRINPKLEEAQTLLEECSNSAPRRAKT